MGERTTLAIALAALVALSSCTGEDAGSRSSSASSRATAQPPKPFTGKLTGERILGADGLAKPGEPWNDGLPRLEGQMGKPTKLTEEGTRQWAVVEDDTCTYIEVGRTPDDKVGIVMKPMAVKKSGPLSASYHECAAITGVSAGPVEDPTAPGPPSGGSAVPLEMFVDVAVKARSKWKGQRVKVLGQYAGVSTSTMTSGAMKVESSSAAIVVDKEKKKPVLSCVLRKGESAPSEPEYAPVVAEGVVAINEMLSGGGEASLEPALEDCTLDFFEADPSKAAASSRPSASAKARP